MKCLILQPVHEAGLALLRAQGVTPVICPRADMATVAGLIGDCEGAVTRDAGLSAEAFAAAPRLRVVVVHGTGHDAVDKVAAAKAGVLVCNTPALNARSVSELAVGLALAVLRGIPAADRAERAGQPGFRESRSFAELSGKTALIVGWGAIGSDVGRMLRAAFGMRVLVHSPRARDLADFTPVGLEEGLAQADLVSLHTPMRPETAGLMNAARLAAMKPGAILLNLGRAGLVEEAALAAALASGHLAGAGLDVYSHGAPQGPLAAQNVVFTPHVGATTEEALRRVAEGAVRSVLTALAGDLPATALNPADWRRRVAGLAGA